MKDASSFKQLTQHLNILLTFLSSFALTMVFKSWGIKSGRTLVLL